jgi:hypothetical protein
MGSYLADLDPYSVNFSELEGQFWGCAGGRCAAKDERPAQSESGPAREGGAYQVGIAALQCGAIAGT